MTHVLVWTGFVCRCLEQWPPRRHCTNGGVHCGWSRGFVAVQQTQRRGLLRPCLLSYRELQHKSGRCRIAAIGRDSWRTWRVACGIFHLWAVCVCMCVRFVYLVGLRTLFWLSRWMPIGWNAQCVRLLLFSMLLVHLFPLLRTLNLAIIIEALDRLHFFQKYI